MFLTETQNISGEADRGGSVQEPASGVTSASHVLFILSKRRNVCRIDRREQQARNTRRVKRLRSDLQTPAHFAFEGKKKKKTLNLIPDTELKGEFCFNTEAGGYSGVHSFSLL